MPRSYVDNAYNRRMGRVGMPVGSCVISRSGEYLGSREYVDNSYNRSLGRVGLPRGSCPASEYGDTWYTGKSTSDYGSLSYTKTPDEKPATPKLNKTNNIQQESEPTKEVANKQETVRDEGKPFDKKLEINQLKEKLLMQEKESQKKETELLHKQMTLNDRIKETDSENSALKANLLKTEQDLVRKTQELSSVEKKLENNLTNIREATVEISSLKARLQKIEESLCKKEQELSGMKGMLDKSEKTAEGLAEEIKSSEREQQKLADQLMKERETTGMLRESDNANKKKIVELADSIMQLQEQMRIQRGRIELHNRYTIKNDGGDSQELDGADKRKLSGEMTRLLECVAEKDQEINRLKEIQESPETSMENLKAEHAVMTDTNRKASAKIKHYERLLRCQHYERLFRRLQIDIDREKRENAYAWRLMTMLSSYMDVMQQKTSGNPGKGISMVAFTAETQALLSNLAKQDEFILQLLNEREDMTTRQTPH